MRGTNTIDSPAWRRFGWDGLLFFVPDGWHLARYEMAGAVTRLAMEDDIALRLEMEWQKNPPELPNTAPVQRRFQQLADAMRSQKAAVSYVSELPANWTAAVYSLDDGRRFVNALYYSPRRLLLSLTLHFERTSLREPLSVMRRLALDFQLLDGPVFTWEFLDLAFELNSTFQLAGVSFETGSKWLVFEWRRRRFFLWAFAPADVIAARQPVAEWCCRVLNRCKLIRGPIFKPSDRAGELAWKRDWRYPFGRFEDLYRFCRAYTARYEILPQRNLLVLTVWHHRNQEDLNIPALRWL